MSGRDWGGDHRSELSVFTARRTPVVDLTAAGETWSPAAPAPAGDVPLADVLDRLLDGLAAHTPPPPPAPGPSPSPSFLSAL
jgi:hypothetical protein